MTKSSGRWSLFCKKNRFFERLDMRSHLYFPAKTIAELPVLAGSFAKRYRKRLEIFFRKL